MSSYAEDLLAFQLTQANVSFARQWRFAPRRRWHIDFRLSWPGLVGQLGVEVEGGSWIPGGGRHNRAEGFQADMIKYNTAAVMGWRILRFTPQMVENGEAMRTIKEALRGEEP